MPPNNNLTSIVQPQMAKMSIQSRRLPPTPGRIIPRATTTTTMATTMMANGNGGSANANVNANYNLPPTPGRIARGALLPPPPPSPFQQNQQQQNQQQNHLQQPPATTQQQQQQQRQRPTMPPPPSTANSNIIHQPPPPSPSFRNNAPPPSPSFRSQQSQQQHMSQPLRSFPPSTPTNRPPSSAPSPSSSQMQQHQPFHVPNSNPPPPPLLISQLKITTDHSTKMNLLSLPDENLRSILEFTLPEKECQKLEWVGVLRGTCKVFRDVAQEFAPTRFELGDYIEYQPLMREQSFDAREGILKTLARFSWMRTNIKEFHVNKSSIHKNHDKYKYGPACDSICMLLCGILTAPESLPKLQWLDINLNCYRRGLINVESLLRIPFALPSLQKLCLVGSFKNVDANGCYYDGSRDVSPDQLILFFSSLQTPLKSLSLSGARWMTDAHVEVVASLAGKNLTRLEIVDCYIYDNANPNSLSDSCLFTIAEHCNNLESFSFAASFDFTSGGLEAVLKANPNITTLDISCGPFHALEDDDGKCDVISRYLPKLKQLRMFNNNQMSWLNNDTLTALIDAQENASDDSSIALEVLGVELDGGDNNLERGIEYAVRKGLKELEVFQMSHTLQMTLDLLNPNVKVKELTDHEQWYYVDGSKYW